MMDEVDKIGADFRGDPSSALLEVLDPEQNNSFRDHYLGVPFDLSKVMFITTANLLDPIQPAFRDRMEVIQLPGLHRGGEARDRRPAPRPQADQGERPDRASSSRSRPGRSRRSSPGYTREAGVRNLEREIASVCRKIARKVAEGKTDADKITSQNVETYPGAAQDLQGPGPEEGPGRRGHRRGLDGDGRRSPVRRGDEDEGQGRAVADRARWATS